MKKSRVVKNINRNTNTLFNHVNHTSRMNTISPEVVVGSMWLQEDNPNSTPITELNSSNSATSPEEFNHFSHAWSYINNDRFQQPEDLYIENRRAREKRRLKNNNQILQPNPPQEASNGYEIEDEYPHLVSKHIDGKNLTLNHQMNCFTIINKHIIDSDTASDNPEYEDIEHLTPRDYFPESECWEANRSYDENEPQQSQDKRTIWIYSFKNKHLLFDNDFKLGNVSSKETTSCSTSCSVENIEEENTNANNTSVFRVATPIPPSYIPRLNLSLGPTLPTVTEVTEPNKPLTSKSVRSIKDEIIMCKQNSWFINDNKIVGSDTLLKQDASTNVIEWMGLSPRERRRRFKSSTVNEKLPTLPEVNSYTEALLHNLKKNEASQVVVDVHVHTANRDPEIEATTVPNDKTIENVIDAMKKIPSEDIDQESVKDDRGDHTRKDTFRKTQIRRPKIQLCPNNKMDEPKISDPIDKLESDNWILEDEKKQTSAFDNDVEINVKLPQLEEDENSASHRLWRKNLSLMKPPQWTEYLPISESPLFLHLSLDSLDEIRQPWYKRMFQYFKCCTKGYA